MEKRKELPNHFLLLCDICSVMVSFFLAGLIRFGGITSVWFRETYGLPFVILLLLYLVSFYTHDSYTGFFQRGFLSEFKVVARHNGMLMVMTTTVMYLIRMGNNYSRSFYVVFFICDILCMFLVRQYYKVIMLAFYKTSGLSNKIMLITTLDLAEPIIKNFKRWNNWDSLITSIAIVDQDWVGQKIDNIEVKAVLGSIMEVAKYSVIDEVFISVPKEYQSKLKLMIEELEEMGITVKVMVDTFGIKTRRMTLQSISGYHVISFRKRSFSNFQLAMKRIWDIFGGIVGLLLTGILILFVAPAIRMESPGPLFFRQIRIGKNGRHFRIYKFRSMYLDAEERKVALLSQNEMQGLMFKMTDDPRVTKVGHFLRKTSLDEFPQFLNVLRGDMSLVGTRPPTEEEFLQYESHHKRRLSFKPGMTGLWQTSGRSEISDFEEVVQLDLEYIDSWSFGLDLKLLIKTVAMVIFGRGAR